MPFRELDPKKVPSLVGERVAVWDPSLVLRTVLRLSLQATSAEVVEAASRASLVAIVKETTPSLVFIGTGPMPGLPVAFSRRIRRLLPAQAAIVLVAPRSEGTDAAVPPPWDHVMNKPFTALQLFAAVARARAAVRRRTSPTKGTGRPGGAA